jgi:histidinol-phosphate aminotransferase
LQEVLAALKRRPRVFFLANPNNPTGTLVPLRDIEKILKAATHSAVVLDEAYADFSGLTAIPWIRRFPQLFIARTFSKAAGLAGLRLGAVMARKDSLEILRRAMPPFPVNIAALVAAETALQDRKAVRKYIQDTLRLRAWFAGELRKLGIRTFPTAGNFLLANFGPTGPALFAMLERQGILLRERTREIGPGYVRITIGAAREMQTLLKEIQRHWVKY